MDSLFRRIGIPPYHLDQILPLIDEASSLSSNPETSTQFHDAAVEIAESMEALAWFLEGPYQHETLPQFEWYEYPPRSEHDILKSIRSTTLRLKSLLFDDFQLPSQIPQPGLGSARLCQHCTWPFQRLARGPIGDGHGLSWSLSIVSFRSPYLLAQDHWPEFPVLEMRSLQGCEFCLFLRKHLLSLVVPQPGELDREPANVWIEFNWTWGTRSLKSVEVVLRGRPHGSRNTEWLYFTIDTQNGGFDCRGSRMSIQG